MCCAKAPHDSGLFCVLKLASGLCSSRLRRLRRADRRELRIAGRETEFVANDPPAGFPFPCPRIRCRSNITVVAVPDRRREPLTKPVDPGSLGLSTLRRGRTNQFDQTARATIPGSEAVAGIHRSCSHTPGSPHWLRGSGPEAATHTQQHPLGRMNVAPQSTAMQSISPIAGPGKGVRRHLIQSRTEVHRAKRFPSTHVRLFNRGGFLNVHLPRKSERSKTAAPPGQNNGSSSFVADPKVEVELKTARSAPRERAVLHPKRDNPKTTLLPTEADFVQQLIPQSRRSLEIGRAHV